MINLFNKGIYFHPTADGGNSTSQKGHYKNVTNFNEAVNVIETIPNYNPTNPLIGLVVLQADAPIFRTAHKNVGVKFIALRKSEGDRKIGFNNFDNMVTRPYNAFTNVCKNEMLLNEAHHLVVKLRGGRIKDVPEPTPTVTSGEEKKNISVSQQDFDALISNYGLLIEVFKAEPLYVPNEADLTITALETYRSTLFPLNNAVKTASEEYFKALDNRDLLLYNAETGMIELTKLFKGYVKSLLGAQDPTFKRLNSIEFVTYHR